MRTNYYRWMYATMLMISVIVNMKDKGWHSLALAIACIILAELTIYFSRRHGECARKEVDEENLKVYPEDQFEFYYCRECNKRMLWNSELERYDFAVTEIIQTSMAGEIKLFYCSKCSTLISISVENQNFLLWDMMNFLQEHKDFDPCVNDKCTEFDPRFILNCKVRVEDCSEYRSAR